MRNPIGSSLTTPFILSIIVLILFARVGVFDTNPSVSGQAVLSLPQTTTRCSVIHERIVEAREIERSACSIDTSIQRCAQALQYLSSLYNRYTVDCGSLGYDIQENPCAPGAVRCRTDDPSKTGWIQGCASDGWENMLYCENGCDEKSGNCAATPCCPPICGLKGGREGWRDHCTDQILMSVPCAGCYAVCENAGTPSEGWYESCTGSIIRFGSCSACDE